MASSKITANGILKQAAWTATSSSATNTRLTGQITIEPGTWLVEGHIPNITSGSMAQIMLENIPNSYRNTSSGLYASALWLLQITATTTISILAGASGAISFGTADRGGLNALKIA